MLFIMPITELYGMVVDFFDSIIDNTKYELDKIDI